MLVLLAGAGQTPARAQSVEDTMRTVWEALWQQTGYPRPMRKWNAPIRIGFAGPATERMKAFVLAQVKAAAEVASIEVSLAEDSSANLTIRIESSDASLPYHQSCTTSSTSRDGIIMRASVRVNEQSVYRCMLHEAMHVMGFSGHPMYRSVLTYFARGTALTEIDKLMLRTLYSDDTPPELSPFAFMAVLARRLHSVAPDADKADVQRATSAFLARTVREMEAFGGGTGEPPEVLFRSSKSSGAGIDRGKVEIQYYLGDAYLNGYIVERDRAKAEQWLAKAAASSHAGAQKLLDRIAADAKH